MFFIMQEDNYKNYRDPGYAIVMEMLHAYNDRHEFVTMKESDLYSDFTEDDYGFMPKLKRAEEFDSRLRDGIAIGQIDFVRKILQIFHGIENEISIEIPPCLRTAKFLKRDYSIVPVWEIPRSGQYFIKDATGQKEFSYIGELSEFLSDEMFEPKIIEYDTSFRFDYEHLYQVSEVVDVLSEYRVYVLSNEIFNISNFKGDPLLFPDIELIKEAVEIYSKQPDCPNSYSLDIMITPKGSAITEVHNFMSLGLYYTNWDEKLLYAYRDGWNYVLNHNTNQTEYKSFD